MELLAFLSLLSSLICELLKGYTINPFLLTPARSARANDEEKREGAGAKRGREGAKEGAPACAHTMRQPETHTFPLSAGEAAPSIRRPARRRGGPESPQAESEHHNSATGGRRRASGGPGDGRPPRAAAGPAPSIFGSAILNEQPRPPCLSARKVVHKRFSGPRPTWEFWNSRPKGRSLGFGSWRAGLGPR